MNKIFLLTYKKVDYFIDPNKLQIVTSNHQSSGKSLQKMRSLWSFLGSLVVVIAGIAVMGILHQLNQQTAYPLSLVLLTIVCIVAELISFTYERKTKKHFLNDLRDYKLLNNQKGERKFFVYGLTAGIFLFILMLFTIHASFIFAFIYGKNGQVALMWLAMILVILSGLSISFIRHGNRMIKYGFKGLRQLNAKKVEF
ncbi:hypothetical protein ACFO26_01810 [Lactococcus nasutitermitis]|uniref:DUF3278 domain-containing protein n=1 Tax=Lactococcus nasutitermitis TaxID=1652957 RepID=A0ABV9JBG1_9LACT|nr:hypothetical protein [Lactococcus nasutitermitis]